MDKPSTSCSGLMLFAVLRVRMLADALTCTTTPITDVALYPTQDGARVIRDAPSPRKKSKKRRRVDPQTLDDDFGQWTPGIDTEVVVEEQNEGEDSGEPVPEPAPAPAQSVVVNVTAGHNRRYLTSDYPMRIWKQDHVNEFLSEFLRRDGLGGHHQIPVCASCKKTIPMPDPLATVPPRTVLTRCRDCYGDCVECSRCSVLRHSRMPLHRTEEWSGSFWKPRTLRSLGLVVQLGHAHDVCYTPDSGHNMTVIDSHGVHSVDVSFCACERSLTASKRLQMIRAGWYPASMTDPQTCATLAVLEEYHLLHLKGALNVHDFISAVSSRSDASNVTTPPDREKAMGRMFRQFAFLKRLKRSGRGHDPAGTAATPLGGCAVLCWACPHERINIPSHWEDVDAKYKFLYMIILAMDANFRLVNRLITNERDDPELGPGWAYTVAPAPYKEHLKGYVSEKDITTCIAFAALLQKDSKATTGLRTSGVGACMCARHEVFRPSGVGDLQKGERYANMDYIFFSSIVGITLLITISYDIVCQWKINLNSRISKLPKVLHPPPAGPNLLPFHERTSAGIPVWHAAAHEDRCRVGHSLRHLPGVGHTDGEGDTLSRRLLVAKEERDVQLAAFDDVRKTVDPAQAETWINEVKEWEKQRNTDHNHPNPYQLPSEGVVTEAEVRLSLQRLETEGAHSGLSADRGATATGFLALGLHIEHLQRQIAAEALDKKSLTANQASVLEERRLQVWRKIRQFREAQRIYMPHAHSCASAEEHHRASHDIPMPLAEVAKLWLPSDLPAAERGTGCDPRLPDMEHKLRAAQCKEALNNIRAYLHAKTHLLHRRNKNVTGQRKSTRASTLISRVDDRITAQQKKYTRAREALLGLDALEPYAHKFRVLLEDHLTLDAEEESPDHEASRLMNRAGGGGPRSKKKKKAGESTRILSWIWVAGSALESGGIHDSVRREFLKARARKHRWVEEVMLLVEEMRRVLRFLNWRAHWWRHQQYSWEGLSDDVSDGLRAYALRQAQLCDSIALAFKTKWAQTEVKAVREAVVALQGLEGTFLAA
ncbi:hypothetical protein HWV62_17380 [Athelia sp. TMB]|nr:hypothetical protein HWV62_17380 [Athelia sp. TMB]